MHLLLELRRQYFLILILFSVTQVIAQIPAEITLHDGTIFNGFADITSKDKIEFRIALEDTPDIFDEIDIIRVEFVDNKTGIYEYVYIKNRFKLLKVVSEGDIIAYAQYSESFSTQKNEVQLKREDYINHDKKILGNPLLPRALGNFGMRKNRFWIKKSGDQKVEDIKLNFRKEAKTWFKNCPGLLMKIQKKELVYIDMAEIVEYYNIYCESE